MEINIRRAEVRDYKAISDITKAAFSEYAKRACPEAARPALTETDDDIIKDIKEKYVLLAFIGDMPVGSLRIETEGKTAYLSRFGVMPGYRSSGCGKALLADSVKMLKEIGVKKLYLHTASKATRLMNFYFGQGFYVVSVNISRGYIRVKMEKKI